MTFLHANANEMNYVIHLGITGLHTIIQITSQILLRLFLVELFKAEFITIRTSLLMSTNPRWKRVLASQHQNSSLQIKTQQSTSIKVPESSQRLPLPSRKRYPTEQKQESETPDPVRTSASTSKPSVSTRKLISTDDLKLQCIHTLLPDKSKRHETCLLKDRHRKVGNTARQYLVPCSSRFLTAPSLTDTASSSVTLSAISSVLSPAQSSIKSEWKKNDEQRIVFRSDRLRVNESSIPHHETDHRLEKEETQISATVPRRFVKHKEPVSIRSSTSTQKPSSVKEISNKDRNSESNAKGRTSSTSKLKRPKTVLTVRAKCHHKPDVSKVRVASTAQLKKRLKKRKNRTCESNTSSCGSSNALDSPSDTAGVKLIATGQHGFFKNAATGSDSVEPSFTTVNVDTPVSDLVQGQVEVRTTRVVGTSIPDELLVRQGVYCPHPNHRSVCVQADGSCKTPGDAKTLFQRLLPRINSLGNTRRKQTSLNTSSSAQSCYSSLLSGTGSCSRTYHGSDSGSEKAYGTSVDVQYGSSGNVRAVLRISSNTVSKYSSRTSAVWTRSGDRLTPIIQGVTLTPPRTPSVQQNQTTLKTAVSQSVPTAVTKRSAPLKKQS